MFPTWEHFQSHLMNLSSPHNKKQHLCQVPCPWPCPLLSLSLSLFVPLSLHSSRLSPTPFPSLPPATPPGAWGAGEPGSTYKPEPLFDNLFLSSSCWQAAGEEQKVNETLPWDYRAGERRAGEPAVVTGN